MNGDRLRVPLEPEYAEAIGRAAYCFASLEWQVVWCCERISPGRLRKICDDEMTAGEIARQFTNVVRNMPPSLLKDEMGPLAERFSELVKVRNAILHGKPCTAPNGEQRLSSKSIWGIPDLDSAADDFTECSSKLNRLYYEYLAPNDDADAGTDST